ncbi:MAG: hypothetical protein ABR992_02250 [Solirubrobacteraceae bacterium]|jgi:hypothetical protein
MTATARTSDDVSVSVTLSVARALLGLAGFERDERGRWTHDDGRWTWGTDEALRWALVTLAETGDEQWAAPARSKAQVRCLTALSRDRGSLTAWNMIASGDVVCRFEDGSIVRIGIDGRYFKADRASLAAHTEAQEQAIAALAERNGPLIAHIPRFDADTVLQFENGRVFRLAADGRCIPAPRSAITQHKESI